MPRSTYFHGMMGAPVVWEWDRSALFKVFNYLLCFFSFFGNLSKSTYFHGSMGVLGRKVAPLDITTVGKKAVVVGSG